MSNLVQTNDEKKMESIEKALIEGDLKPLKVEERVSYYNRVCESLTINPYTKPFDYIFYNGKLVLYPNKNCAEQLRARDSVSVKIVSKEKFDNVFCVTVNAKNEKGREDEASAYLDLNGLSGQALANALMKTETKAKRRVTLSICGLGMTDETEWESMESAIPVKIDFDQDPVIAANVQAHNEEIKKSEIPKPKNHAPCNMQHLNEIVLKCEKKDVKKFEMSNVMKTLFNAEKFSDLKIWQVEELLNCLDVSLNRDDFFKRIVELEIKLKGSV